MAGIMALVRASGAGVLGMIILAGDIQFNPRLHFITNENIEPNEDCTAKF